MNTINISVGYWNYICKHPKFTGCLVDVWKTTVYYKNGLLHREEGPTIEYNDGTKCYYKNGLVHREDGPAVEWNNGDEDYYINGKQLSYREWSLKTKLKRIVYKLEGGDGNNRRS